VLKTVLELPAACTIVVTINNGHCIIIPWLMVFERILKRACLEYAAKPQQMYLAGRTPFPV
jgi:hypothetical protein